MLSLDLIASLGALFGLCLFANQKLRIHSALAPLVCLSVISIWFTLAGVLDVMRPAGWLLYTAAYALGGWALWQGCKQKTLRQQFSCGSLLFWGLAVFFAVYFSVRQPMFSTFDEFSFWGTAAQMTSATDRLYTVGNYGTPWLPTQNPGLVMLSYFVQFFGEFAHFKVYLGYDLLLFACAAALVGTVEIKNYKLAVPLAVIGWLTPWFLTTYRRMQDTSKVYMSAYGDIPAGMLAGGAVVLWFALRQQEDGPRWPIFPVLAFLANVKDNTFPLALIAAGLIAADAFLFDCPVGQWKKGWPRRLGFSAGCLLSPLVLYRIWGGYIARLVVQNSADGGMGATSEDTISVAINGTRMLFGLDVPEYYQVRAQRFADSAQRMTDAFYHTELTAVGPGVIMTGLILCLFAAAVLFARDGRSRLRAFLWGLGSSVGFVAYNYVLTLCYGFIFKEFQAVRLEDYNRYMYTYYIGWFLIAVTVLVWTVRAARYQLLGNGCILAFSCLMLLRVNMLVPPQFGVLGFSDTVFADQHIKQNKAEAIKAEVTPEDRIFYIRQGDDGLEWFSYGCYLQPNVLDYSGWLYDEAGDRFGGGGGTFGLPGQRPSLETREGIYYHAYQPQELEQVIRESGCQYIFVDRLDDGFVESYGALFADNLLAAQEGETLLYRVEPEGFVPVEMEVPA